MEMQLQLRMWNTVNWMKDENYDKGKIKVIFLIQFKELRVHLSRMKRCGHHVWLDDRSSRQRRTLKSICRST